MFKSKYVKIGISLAIAGILFFVVMFSSIISILFAGAATKNKYDLGSLMDGLPPPITEEMVIAAIKSYETYGVPTGLTLAQIILESSGSYEGGLSQLAYECKNLFGIKGEGPAGSKEYETKEQRSDGSVHTVTAKFRKYRSYEESIMEHGKLLTSGRYKAYTAKATTTDEWTKAIHNAGYATDTSYSTKLINLMSTYNLYRFDGITLEMLRTTGEGDGVFSGKFIWPLRGHGVITSPFGPRSLGGSSYHYGVDVGIQQGTPILAADGGKVITAGYIGDGGYAVEIDHGNGVITRYLHMMYGGVMVKVGQKVSKGQQIGKVGSTGFSTGPHLHFAIKINGTYVNPMKYVVQP